MDTLLPQSVYTNEWDADPNAYLKVDSGMSNPDDSDYVVAPEDIGAIFSNNLGELSFIGPIGTLRIAFRYAGEDDGFFTSGPAADFSIALDGTIVTSLKRFALLTDSGAVATGIAVFTPSDFTTTLTGAIWNAATSRRMRCVVQAADRSEDGDPPPGPWFSG